jgi:hypothetical protein
MKGDSVLVQQTGKPRAVKIEKGIEDDFIVEIKSNTIPLESLIIVQ